MPSRGSFVLHDAVRPAVPDGAYRLSVTQELDPVGQSVDPLDRHLVVSGPRFVLPPGQALSTFPPNNAVGAFSTRLPQIVLRRRTLPWERSVDTADPALPWLALVVLADGEGHLASGQAVDTSGLADPELRDSDTRDVLTVSATVVAQIFPTKLDLPWLCHVREVDLTDTELALGDDDGWLAVVLANRLPQPGVRYTACLVSLEDRGADLPTKEEPDSFFNTLTVYDATLVAEAAVRQRRADAVIDAVPPALVAAERAVEDLRAGGGARATAAPAAAHATTLVGALRPATTPSTPRDAWSARGLPAAVAGAQQAAGGTEARVTGHSSVVGLGIRPELIEPLVPTLSFTVLTHWSFTCSDGGDFESLMRELDDGMLGTAPTPPAAAGGGGPPPAPATRPDLVVTDTGHVATAAVSRRGVAGTAWYRSPFSPRQIVRAMADDAHPLVLLHAADQARRVGPDGREDLSLAAAFEVGRLLAVSQPVIVAALLGWRRTGYRASRLRAILSQPAGLRGRLLEVLDEQRTVFGAGVAASLLAGVGGNVGPVRPSVDPGPDLLGGAALAGVLASGFGLDHSEVLGILATGAGATGLDASATASRLPIALDALEPAAFASLHAGLDARVTSLVRQATILGEANR